MIFKPPSIGVAAVFGSEELAGAALALALTEALADAEAVGDPLSTTKVVVLSPPHPHRVTATSPTNRTTPNPFITLLLGRAHYSSRS
jgi:hypothetical protein